MAIGAFPMSVGSSDNHITHIYGLPKVEATRVAYGETVFPGANPPLEPIMALKVWDFFTREEFKRGSFKIDYLPTADMPADGFTKALNRQHFEKFRSMLSLVDTRNLVQTSPITEIDERKNNSVNPGSAGRGNNTQVARMNGTKDKAQET
ncbi:hypothetical protein E4U44_006078 [Claviceps purpurea]|nr:hypothetical protein E4U44_006078 [Claviceps purpurea]